MPDEKVKKEIFEAKPEETKPEPQPQVATTEQAPQEDTHDKLLALAAKERGETVPQKQTEEQKQEREELYQTRYQSLTEKLRKFSPQAYQQIMSEVKGEDKAKPVTKEAEKDDTYADEIVMSANQLSKMVREAVREETGGMLQKQRQEDIFALEQQTAEETIREFKKAGVDDTALAEAYNAVVAKYGIDIKTPGGPSMAVTALADELEMREMRKRSGLRATTATEEAEAKVKAAAQVAQPSAASPPGPQERSFDRTVVDEMASVGNPEAKKAIFKGTDA